MASTLLGLLLFVLIGGALANKSFNDNYFDHSYAITWGGDHVTFLDQGREIQLFMDQSSGSGFGSKVHLGSGFFHFNMKVPGRNSGGVVTAFYLSSKRKNGHDEVDFEFLGNVEGKPYTLQTNVFANGIGNREQRFRLWFDPTSSFHTYKILWNPYQIVFFVDGFPIRVFKNKTNIGVGYPSKPMKILASLWNGDDWATDGGKTKVNWTYAPFMAHFKGFNLDGCLSKSHNSRPCSSPDFWWNSAKFQSLSASQEKAYKLVKDKFMTYDYCSDKSKYPTPPPECPQ